MESPDFYCGVITGFSAVGAVNSDFPDHRQLINFRPREAPFIGLGSKGYRASIHLHPEIQSHPAHSTFFPTADRANLGIFPCTYQLHVLYTGNSWFEHADVERSRPFCNQESCDGVNKKALKWSSLGYIASDLPPHFLEFRVAYSVLILDCKPGPS